jgi:hypothetical protein
VGPVASSGGALVFLMLPFVMKQLAIATGAFAVTAAVAEAAGAANLGTALGFGQIAFALAVVGLLLWA